MNNMKKKKNYEELANLVISGKMGYLEFIKAQEPYARKEYGEWCKDHGLTEDDTSAEQYLRDMEEAFVKSA